MGVSHDKLFHLCEAELHSFLLKEMLAAVDSQLDPSLPTFSHRVLIAEELSMLSAILIRKWVDEAENFAVAAVEGFICILTSCSRLDPSVSYNITVSTYSSLLQLLTALHTTKDDQPTSKGNY